MQEQSEFKDLRVLVASHHGADVLRTVFAMMGLRRIAVALSADAAIQMLSTEKFAAVFFDETIEAVQGVPFALALRRKPEGANPAMLLFLLCTGPGRAEVERARELGITDILVKPLSPATVASRLRRALTRSEPGAAQATATVYI